MSMVSQIKALPHQNKALRRLKSHLSRHNKMASNIQEMNKREQALAVAISTFLNNKHHAPLGAFFIA
ncbi:MAG: hypothetical protein MSC43_06720 [Clostridiales bacterium]|nr:hypothetical protein [Clostridiales bacterium]MDD7433071.1 hypothetical protein [Clostridiales bacterium]MDY3061786.1 hypothetical protein [Eubacteriales bacterium]